MSKKILFVVSAADHWTLADGTRRPAGFWAEEFVAPYEAFTAAGHQITVATPGGAIPTVDAVSLDPAYAGGDENAAHLRSVVEGAPELTAPLAVDAARLDEYDAVFYPGGWGPMEDLSGDAASAALLTGALTSGTIIALVCHGPAALLPTVDAQGESPFSGYRLTALSNAEEAAGGMADRAKWLLQDRLVKDLAADYREGPAYEPHIEIDRNLYTGQNPGLSAQLAEAVLQALR